MVQTLESGRSGLYPTDFMSTQAGEVFFCNGLEKPRRWDGSSASSETAGIEAPSTALTLAGSGTGTLSGTYDAYVRFVDDEGIPSSLSPVSNEVTVTNVAQLDYSNIPVSTNPRVVKRQIFRNTNGQKTTYYLDVEINDNITTSATSTNDDTALLASTPLPILNPDGSLNANRFVPPPTKPFLAAFYDRFFYAGEVLHSFGRVSVTNGSNIVTGVGTMWRGSLNGAYIKFAGSQTVFQITGVVASSQTITLDKNYDGPTNSAERYMLLGSKDEWHRVFYSFALEPESVPAVNNVVVQDDGDWITGLMPFQNYLYLLKRHHIYRLSMARSSCPGIIVQYAANRGCVNNRCWVQTGDMAFLLDEEGIWLFQGQSDKPISAPVQRLWREGVIRWEYKDWFFAGIDRTRKVIRWFVSFGEYPLRTAICFHYKRGTFWIEKYPVGVGAAVEMDVGGVRSLVLCGEGESCWTLSGKKDLVANDAPPLALDSSGPYWIKDSDTPATSADVGLPVSILTGKGAGQVRRITKVSSGVIRVDAPWAVKPKPGDKYQVGGIPWIWRSKDFFLPFNPRHASYSFWVNGSGDESPTFVSASLLIGGNYEKLYPSLDQPTGTDVQSTHEVSVDLNQQPTASLVFGVPTPLDNYDHRSAAVQFRGKQPTTIRFIQVHGLDDVRSAG